MARVREIRDRVAAIKKTQKITSAMRMISAARLARAQTAAESSRAYGAKLTEIFASVARGLDADAHPLLARRASVRKLDVLLVTSDRGLCGAYNANLIKAAVALVADRRAGLDSVSVVAVGKRGRDFCRRRRIDMPKSWTGLAPTPENAREIAKYVMDRYLAGESDELMIVYGRFVTVLTQTPTALSVIPVLAAVPEAKDGPTLSYEIEPDPASFLAAVLPRVIEFAVLRALLENAASEHGARMTAMENATENTRELILSLTLDMNKARQTQITTELTEIVAGAEAL
ncbi:MAG TPA: ATP synthase F1 subunit gamma [Myxococcota bacterium]|nr:ATP synthase F1 subunit gamma [Myxococcota bacterium]